MTSLSIQEITMPTAPLGADNPLPPLFGSGNRDYTVDMSAAPTEIRDRASYGRVGSIAPHLLQDEYDRERVMAKHPVAVLENETLRATFLLGAGGRLWSLVHRATNRELLFRNDVLQPANLALRNAWFAGGIEWNVGTIGHTPGTFSPIHAARVQHADGTPVLRMWEYDRIRRIVFQLDMHLPEGSPALFVNVRMSNPGAEQVPTYWWSNTAVPQTADTRVLTCADEAWNYSYAERLSVVPVVDADLGTDASYPGRAVDAADYFFDTRSTPFPWIAALGRDGSGLGQISTEPLRGRKLFLWGTGAGGSRWQEWLCGPGQSYIEIQAGLARTQFEHVPLPGGSEISWVEAYGRLDVMPAAAHGTWHHARAATEAAVHELADSATLVAERQSAQATARLPVSEILHRGTGWGALARLLDTEAELEALHSPATPFDDESLTSLQTDWLEFRRTGRFPHNDPREFPRSYTADPIWRDQLAGADGWIEAALLGNLLAALDDVDGARSAWERSMSILPNVLAARNLGALARHLGDLPQALSWYGLARELNPLSRPLAVEALRVIIAAGNSARALEVVDALPPDLRHNSRIRLLEAIAAIGAGDPDRGGDILLSGLELADLREGEESLEETWFDYRTALYARSHGVLATPELRRKVSTTEVVPRQLDFRMSATAGTSQAAPT